VAKPLIAKLLNCWKAEFRQDYGRDPKKSDILHDPAIAVFYRAYTEWVTPAAQ